MRSYGQELQERVGAVAFETGNYFGGFYQADELTVEPQLQIDESY